MPAREARGLAGKNYIRRASGLLTTAASAAIAAIAAFSML